MLDQQFSVPQLVFKDNNGGWIYINPPQTPSCHKLNTS